MTTPKARRTPVTTQEYVLAELRHRIARREIRPGEAVRQELLAEELGVSRVPVREALKILQGEGQILYRPQRGYYVAELSLDDLTEVYRIRELLETEAALLAVERASDNEIAEVAAICQRLSLAAETADVNAMIDVNREFHFRILEASRMPRLMRLVRILWDATDTYRSVYYGTADNRERVQREHVAMVNAYQARDGRLLVALLEAHRSHAVMALKELLAADQAEAKTESIL